MRCIIIIVKSLLHFNLKICALHTHWNVHEPAHWYAISRNHTRTHTWHTHTERRRKSQQHNCHLQYHTMYDAIGDLGGLLGSKLSSPPLLSSSKRNCALQHFKTRTPPHTHPPLSIDKVSLWQRGCLWMTQLSYTLLIMQWKNKILCSLSKFAVQ